MSTTESEGSDVQIIASSTDFLRKFIIFLLSTVNALLYKPKVWKFWRKNPRKVREMVIHQIVRDAGTRQYHELNGILTKNANYIHKILPPESLEARVSDIITYFEGQDVGDVESKRRQINERYAYLNEPHFEKYCKSLYDSAKNIRELLGNLREERNKLTKHESLGNSEVRTKLENYLEIDRGIQDNINNIIDVSKQIKCISGDDLTKFADRLQESPEPKRSQSPHPTDTSLRHYRGSDEFSSTQAYLVEFASLMFTTRELAIMSNRNRNKAYRTRRELLESLVSNQITSIPDLEQYSRQIRDYENRHQLNVDSFLINTKSLFYGERYSKAIRREDETRVEGGEACVNLFTNLVLAVEQQRLLFNSVESIKRVSKTSFSESYNEEWFWSRLRNLAQGFLSLDDYLLAMFESLVAAGGTNNVCGFRRDDYVEKTLALEGLSE